MAVQLQPPALNTIEAPLPNRYWLAAVAGSLAVGMAVAANPVLAVGAMGALGLLVCFVWRPPVAMALWSLSFFALFAPIGNLLMKGGFVLVLAALVIRATFRRGTLVANVTEHWRIVAIAGCLLGWIALSTLWASDTAVALVDLRIWSLVVIGVFVAALDFFHGERATVLLVAGWAAGASLAGLTAVLETAGVLQFAAFDGLTPRAGGAAGDPNILAAGLVAAVILLIGLWSVFPQKPARLAFVAMGLVSVVAVVGTASRGAIVAIGVATIAAVATSKRPVRLVATSATVVPLAAGTWALLSPESWARTSDFGGGGTGRTELWRAATHLWTEHPITGVGIGNMVVDKPTVALDIGPLSYGRLIAERPLVAHNMFLQVLSEVGIIGFALLVGVLAISMRSALRAATTFRAAGRPDLANLSRAVFIAVVSLLGAGVFLSMEREYRLWLILAAGPLLKSAANAMASNTVRANTVVAGR